MTGEREDGRLAAFAHVTADKAPAYRAVMRVFTVAKERFALHLRPADVARALYDDAPLTEAEVETCLLQLCEWGNLRKDTDTAEVATVEEFYRTRYLYQLTVEGEAAERALATYHDAVAESGELQAAALGDIRELLGELAALAEAGEPDDAKVHRILTTLRTRFDELTAKAQTFIAGLQRTIDLHGVDVATFVAYKDTLIDYLERFIGQLVMATADIVDHIERVERAGAGDLLTAAARRDLADALAPTDADAEEAVERWRGRWAGLRAWFIGSGAAPSQAEVLRARARSAIPALLQAVASINDRRVTRTDRFTDLRALARWFAEADNDADAHRLWRAAFALTPARHLQVNADTLDERDADPVSPQTSWLTAPPLRLSPRLRRSGRHAKRGRPADVVDRSAGKALIAATIEAEAAQIEAARRRLATGRPTLLSDLGDLDPCEFDLFLDLLGEALAAKVRPGDAVETTSTDGTLVIILVPAAGTATIATSAGRLVGPEHLVTIRDAFAARAVREPVGASA
ncbi:MAG TPA: TIGR02677 family protein [Egibacteraceae bacterium]|nr:TIGR02677 family protein [Egibacteraceae bacterium]